MEKKEYYYKLLYKRSRKECTYIDYVEYLTYEQAVEVIFRSAELIKIHNNIPISYLMRFNKLNDKNKSDVFDLDIIGDNGSYIETKVVSKEEFDKKDVSEIKIVYTLEDIVNSYFDTISDIIDKQQIKNKEI